MRSPVSIVWGRTQDGDAVDDATNYHFTYAYVDGMGRTVVTLSEADRSLGEIEGNYQIVHAENIGKPGGKNGRLDATWDAAGYLLSLDMQRDGACIPSGSCGYTSFEYLWDEVGRLVRAKRWDNWTLGADLTYQYDASDSRVLKTAHEGTAASHSVYIFGSLELRRATWTGTEYEHTDATEVPYLFAHGVRLARVVHTSAPDFTSPSTRVYLELGDHLGSTSVVLDLASGELVERSTAYAYGAVESDYRPGRWDSFREEYRFTGKEDEIEVGLQYFGARYYAPLLGRWISADPLAVHAPGKADLNLYAYVHGRVLVAVDPVGLDEVDAKAAAYQSRMQLLAMRGQAASLQGPLGVASLTDGLIQWMYDRYGRNRPAREGIAPFPGEAALWRTQFTHYLPRRFLDRYMANTGQTYVLTKQEALDTLPRIDLRYDYKTDRGRIANPSLAAEVSSMIPEAEQTCGPLSKAVAFTGKATSGLSGGLGTFTVHYQGRLTVQVSDGQATWKFEGKMRFYDEWSFERHAPGSVSNRNAQGAARVEQARKYLAGTPFAIVGPEFNVSQSSSDPSAKWEGSAGQSQVTNPNPTQAGTMMQQDVNHNDK